MLLLALGGLLVFPCVLAALLARWLPRALARQQLFWLGLAVIGLLSAGGFLLLARPQAAMQQQFITLMREVIVEITSATWNVSRLWSDLRPLWVESVPFIPLAACLAHLLAPQSARERLLLAHEDQTSALRAASKRAERWAKSHHLPDQVQQGVVLGLPIGKGQLTWTKKGLVVLPREAFGKHGVVIGGSGSGKSNTLLRLAILATKVLGWQVIYIDGKGDEDAGKQFVAAMKSAGVRRVMFFPAEAGSAHRRQF